MKGLFQIGCAALIIGSLCCISTAEAARRQRPNQDRAEFAGCNKIIKVQTNGLIYKNSAPLRSGGVGTPLIGYRKEPSLIMVKNISNRSTTTIFDSQGNKIGSCPWASAHDTYGGRYRCTMQTASLRKAAMKKTKSPKIYFKLKGTTCAEVPDAGRCYGSVKGLCNQLIK